MLSLYGVRYVLVEMKGEYEERIWQQAQHHPDFKPVSCFPPLAGPSPWPNPICVIEVKLAPAVAFDTLQLGAGWHPTEAWGTWAQGQQSHAGWFDDGSSDYRLDVKAFPMCVRGRQQAMLVEVNGTAVGSHTWQACEAWAAKSRSRRTSPGQGWNHLRILYAYSAKPAELDPQASGDYRDLSAGFTQLALSPAP